MEFLHRACPLLDTIQGILVPEVPRGPQSSVESSVQQIYCQNAMNNIIVGANIVVLFRLGYLSLLGDGNHRKNIEH